MTYQWTAEDEIELTNYEKQLKRSEYIRKNAGWIVGGAFIVVTTGLTTLAVLLATS